MMLSARDATTHRMPYVVEWSEQAIEDLLTKVRTERVASELYELAQVALDDHVPPDGGVVEAHGTIFWRRGLTTQQRAELDKAETAGQDCDAPGVERAYSFRFVYRRRGRFGHGWHIIALFHESDIAGGLP